MKRDWPRGFLMAALCGGYFLVLLDVTVVNVALPQIGSGLHAGSAGLAWVVDAYAVPLAALLLASGAIGDRLGHRAVVLLGFVGFGAASVLCALAPTIVVLIVAHAVQGIGAALMLPGTLALLSQNANSAAAHARIVGVWAAIGGAALPAGPVVGGLLVQVAEWRAVFWLSVPVITLALAPIAQLPRLHNDTSPDVAVHWTGAILLVIGLACGVTAIIQGRSSSALAGAFVFAAMCIAAAFWRAERLTRCPLLHVPRSARRSLAAACLVAGLMNLCTLGSLFLLTQIFQDMHGLSPLLAGPATLPAMLPLPLLGASAGRLSARFGVWRTSALGLFVSAIGFAGIAASITHPNYAWLLCSLALWGTGLGILTPTIVAAALQAASETLGVASGASNTSRQTGGALGVAIFSAIAGDSNHTGFLLHSVKLFTGAGLAFVFAAALCLAIARWVSRADGAWRAAP